MKTSKHIKMIYRHTRRVSFIAILFLYFSVLQSSFSHSQSDSLYRYLTIAARNNPGVQQKFYEYLASLQKVPQVGSLPDPELNLGIFIQPMELVAGNQIADIRLMQMFPWFGTLKAAKDEMSLMARAKYESFRDAKLQVFFDIKRTWYELQKVQQDIRISEKNLDILHTIERLTLVRFKTASSGGANSVSSSMQSSQMGASAGGSGLADLYRIQIETGELENNIALMKTRLNTVTAKFNAYLNRPSESEISLPHELLPDSLGLSLLAVTDSMLLNNPMLNMLLYEQQSLNARKKMVTRMGAPMMGLGLNYSVISKSDMSTSPMNGKDMVMPMATITLPVYRGRYNAMKTETDLLKTATGENYSETVNSLKTDYYEAVQLFKDGQRRRILYDNQSDLAGKSLDIMLKNFTASATPLTDILRVRQQLLDYELKKIEAIADYNTAVSWLQRLMASAPIMEN